MAGEVDHLHLERSDFRALGQAIQNHASAGEQPQRSDTKRKKKYAGLLPDEMRRLKALEDENTRLKKIVADLTLDREMLQDVIRRKL